MNAKALSLTAAAAFMLVGCTESVLLGSESESQQQVSPDLILGLPKLLDSVRMENRDALFATIQINDETFTWSQDSDFIRSISVNSGDQVNLSVNWSENLADGSDLELAYHNSTHTITVNNTALMVSSDDYLYDLDDDEDGFNNLEERRATPPSDPTNAASVPVLNSDANVSIPRIDPEQAPVINGRYEAIWDQAQFFDTNGDRLNIDNLMVDQGADRDDGATEFRWFAMHDGTNLYLWVFGEIVDQSTPFRDSTLFWHDDNLNLFLDGDNSKGEIYDGFDDRQILIPLSPVVTDVDNLTGNDSVFVKGENSAPLPPFEFASCFCPSGEQHNWEIKIPLSEFNISVGRPFGIDIQLDNDNDGGDRDAKWGWFHPSRVDSDVDFTWNNPSFMGSAVLQ